MKNKKQFTLIELIIVIVVIGILAAMALPKFNGVVRGAKLSAMINDKETLEKVLVMYYQKNDELPLLNEDEELIVKNNGISLSKIVLAEDVKSSDMETIYKSLKETLTYYNDSEDTLYRIDLPKIKDNLGKDIKYGHKKNDKDFYVYSTKTGNVYYYDYLVNGNGTIQHSEYDTLLKDNELLTKAISPSLSSEETNKENNPIIIEDNTITVGSTHSMKIGNNGDIYSWGNNEYGQLGIGFSNPKKTPQKINLPNGEKSISIFSKTESSMTITDKGNVYSWGNNEYGKLGVGNKINQSQPQLVKLPNGEKPKFIHLSNFYSFIITNEGNLYSYGSNGGKLGIGNTSDQYTPQRVNFSNGVKEKVIALGNSHVLMIGNDDNLYSWGGNSFGELGIGYKVDKLEPQIVTIPNGEKPISISVGKNHSMVITDKGSLYSWGKNNYGQLGLGNTENQTTPQLVTIPNEEKIISVSLSENSSMALTDKGNLYAWGDNTYGQLGTGNTINQITPQLVTIPNGEKPIYISLKYQNSSIITNKNNLYVCGKNEQGQLGIGNTTNQSTPQLVEIPNEEKVTSINIGAYHSIISTNKGNIYSWGYNAYGQIGIGNIETQLIPTNITIP